MARDTLRRGGGRHRLGVAGLRHCRDIEAVRERLATGRRYTGGRETVRHDAVHLDPVRHDAVRHDAVRQAADEPAARTYSTPAAPNQRRTGSMGVTRWAAALGGSVVAAVLLVSGWYTAAGASAVAQMISP